MSFVDEEYNPDFHPGVEDDYYHDGVHSGQEEGDEENNLDRENDLNRQRNKRRSKNDNEGRTYQCGCGKSYLSYPALYTHIKQKHDGMAPEGTNSAQFHTGRGRGRPRKPRPDLHMGEIVNLTAEQQAANMQNDAQMLSQLNRDLTDEMLQSEVTTLGNVPFPTTVSQKKATGQSISGQASVIDSQSNAFDALNWYTDEPCDEDELYSIVQEVNEIVRNSLQSIEEHMHEKRPNCGQSTQYLILIPDEDRQSLSIDQVLALYLIDVAELCKQYQPPKQAELTAKDTKANQKQSQTSKDAVLLQRNNLHFNQTTCCFVQQYRNCLIDTLTRKFAKKTSRRALHRVTQAQLPDSESPAAQEDLQGQKFTQTKSPECIPLICNDFLTSYLPLKCNVFDIKIAIGMTQHMCEWLHNRKFTKAKLSLI